MNKILEKSLELMETEHFDTLAVGVLDFKARNYRTFEITNRSVVSKNPYLYFDLASITKPLTLSSTYLLHPELFDDEMLLLLDHEGGLPSGGRVSKASWREQLLGYKIKKSETLYSDYSALRLMLELEKKSKKKLKELCSSYWDQELCYFKDLPKDAISPVTGTRNWQEIRGVVHDDNAFVIGEFTSHAGLFGTVSGLSKTLLNLNEKVNLIKVMGESLKKTGASKRFVHGFDRVQDVEKTLAGAGCSINTFGHTGFTGTSFWIDTEKNRGAVILSNATQNYWYDRDGLNRLRRIIGEMIWNG